MEGNLEIFVNPVELKEIPNDYYGKMKTEMFKETIRINFLTCVYRKWESTQYTLNTMPSDFGEA
jgi:hypothetical protein